ncbi:MAG: DUF6273 domain-containing protein, partial [Actinomycetia bacterium]|nr:DUF6273 domain-containing protein [Actinomycetes bacterium]
MLALGLYPASAFAAVGIEAGGGSLTEGTGNLTGTQVYFGAKDGSPILWNVVVTDGGSSAILWTTTSVANTQYDLSGHNNWSGSAICAWLNGTAMGKFLNGFSTAELTAIAPFGSTEPANPAMGVFDRIDISQKIVLPSVAEMGSGTTTGTWGINQATRATLNQYWWLRSPGMYSYAAARVAPNGSVSPGGDFVFEAMGRAVFPALRLDLSSVIFTSAASGANTKSAATVGGGLIDATLPTSPGPVKLTLSDSSIETPTLLLAGGNGTSAISFDYSGATTGTNQYVSCTLTDASGNVVYYGKLADTSTNAAGSLTVPLSGVADGSYTLNVFGEQANGDTYTDYAGSADSIPITVSSGAGTINPFTATVDLTIDSIPANATSVALGASATDPSPVPMAQSGPAGSYTLDGIPEGEVLYIFVNGVFTGISLSDATPANVALFTVSFAPASTGTGTTGPITAAYASTNPVVQNHGLAILNGDLVVLGSVVTFSVAGAAATDTIAWGGGAATSSTPAASSTNVVYSALTAQVTCTVTAFIDGGIPPTGDTSLPSVLMLAALFLLGG